MNFTVAKKHTISNGQEFPLWGKLQTPQGTFYLAPEFKDQAALTAAGCAPGTQVPPAGGRACCARPAARSGSAASAASRPAGKSAARCCMPPTEREAS